MLYFIYVKKIACQMNKDIFLHCHWWCVMSGRPEWLSLKREAFISTSKIYPHFKVGFPEDEIYYIDYSFSGELCAKTDLYGSLQIYVRIKTWVFPIIIQLSQKPSLKLGQSMAFHKDLVTAGVFKTFKLKSQLNITIKTNHWNQDHW